MGEQRGLAPLLTVDLAPVTVELNLRESGARFPCKWSSVLEIYNPKDSELNMYAILTMGFQGNLSMAQTYYTAAKPYLALEHAEVIKKYLNVK